ncbi:transcriptional regulator, AsnC family [Phenylobacterium zucineum HLK1]|uniref:Transcriptional regulator, AsnC family n=1 Tax=Phenylobacterium zucineum (strain HLK1) TaxID=450851 RepID=B4RFZ9_PHEZH|nr:AsnC family transcriptional regulator [Phenylobacterium zucineum]ACG78812.1 transcriptional regulator, AsnC family [Phenylobacterium zucineum HLK1]
MTPSRRRAAQPGITAQELARIARFEGVPRLMITEVGTAIGMTSRAAWGWFDRLRERGVLRAVAVVNPALTLGRSECRVLIKVDCLDRARVGELEAMFLKDPQVITAARVVGEWDYQLRAYHPSEADTDNWFRTLQRTPGVLKGELTYCHTILERHAYAAALLGSDAAERPRCEPQERQRDRRQAGRMTT